MVSTLLPSAILPSTVDAALADAGELRLVVRAVVASILRERVEHADVEDGTNEALRRALERRGATRAYVIGIARHVALDALRARQRQRAREGTPEPPPSSATSLVERLADPSAGADVRIEEAEREARVRRVLATLPEGPRRALELFHLESLAYQEIARRLGVPLGTVATWVTRGRKAMADALEEDR